MQTEPEVTARGLPLRTLLWAEIALVLGLSLGRSAVYAAVNLLRVATEPGPLSSSSAVMNRSLVPDRPWFDLTYQLLGIAFGVVPVLLAGYFLLRSGERPGLLWFGRGTAPAGRLLGADTARGAVVAAVVGSTGVAFYLLTHALGINLTVVPEDLPDSWWKIPVLVGWALENALLEELVVIGFVLVRLRRLGWGRRPRSGRRRCCVGPTTSTRDGAASLATR
ncbi:MAG: hypothetical protein R2731_00265 [Nocardioides sp.]